MQQFGEEEEDGINEALAQAAEAGTAAQRNFQDMLEERLERVSGSLQVGSTKACARTHTYTHESTYTHKTRIRSHTHIIFV